SVIQLRERLLSTRGSRATPSASEACTAEFTLERLAMGQIRCRSMHLGGRGAHQLRPRHLGVRVLDAGQVAGPRTGADILQKIVVARVFLRVVNFVLGILEISENNGSGTAGI